MQCDTLRNEDVLWEGYRPKMLLYALDELFYIYDQVKHHRRVDEKLVVAYEILSLTARNAEDGWKNTACQTPCHECEDEVLHSAGTMTDQG